MKITRDLPQTGPTVISRFEGEYYFLSNFYPVGIQYKQVMYPTVEHAYQAAKFEEPEMREYIRGLPTPGRARKVAREDYGKYIRSDWPETRVPVMRAFTWIKYRDVHLRRLLQKTGTRLLIEGNEWGDKFWGVCGGEGENQLGRLLMRTRLQNKFDHWAAVTGRFEPARMTFNPWTHAYALGSVQREWEAFAEGFANGHDIDYRKVLE